MQQIEELQRGGELLAVLRGALDCGLLEQLTEPCAPIVDGVPPRRLAAVLGLLSSYAVVEPAEPGWQLTAAWRPLVVGETFFDLEATLGIGRVRAEQVGAALSGSQDYWQLSDEDRLLVARGMSFDPSTPQALDIVRRGLDGLPDVLAALESGGAMLELGCGVGSRMTALLRVFPAAHAVGVELSPDLVEAGRRQAAELGVGDRLTYVCADATRYQPDREFDLVAWSQFFFPRPTRSATLGTALRALRPGAWLSTPVIWDGRDLAAGTEQQEMAAERLVLDLWDVPLRTTDEVSEELRAAGFTDVRVDSDGLVHFVRGRKPGGA